MLLVGRVPRQQLTATSKPLWLGLTRGQRAVNSNNRTTVGAANNNSPTLSLSSQRWVVLLVECPNTRARACPDTLAKYGLLTRTACSRPSQMPPARGRGRGRGRRRVVCGASWGDFAHGPTVLNNSNNTKLAQHLNNVRPRFERYGNVTW